MPFTGLKSFVQQLEKAGQLIRVTSFADPVLEITEITDRISKTGGPALLFENNGTQFPLLINAFGSDKRMAMALGKDDLDEPAGEIEKIFNLLTQTSGSFTGKLSAIPSLLNLARYIPSRSGNRGRCQQVVHKDPDLGILPVLKCWPHDGGLFITLPVVNTFHPVTSRPNAGMYRMQILDKKTTAMHWQLHKTGATHFEEWRKAGKKMPVSVILGGDPVYTYAATAPLPENIDEYLLAGFLRQKKVRLVKCLTNEIYVPEDADFVIEGYVDPSEKPVWEGPFGDHTGFYSLADWYPEFHVTCITHAREAIYPATIVGIPPMEDAFMTKATERIFLAPLKLAVQPEIEDLHMPEPGVAHNLVVVKIRKSYPGQGMKVLNSLFGAGQMMFSKYLAVVSGDVNIRDYTSLLNHIIKNIRPSTDLIFSRGPLDVLDHSSDTFAFGGKVGIDATIKMEDEKIPGVTPSTGPDPEIISVLDTLVRENKITAYNIPPSLNLKSILILSVNIIDNPGITDEITEKLKKDNFGNLFRVVIIVDHTVDVTDHYTVTWQLLGNSDPFRDHWFVSDDCVVFDGTIKFFRAGGFLRRWPNIVCSDELTIKAIDKKWDKLGLGHYISSPSSRYLLLEREGREEVTKNENHFS
ncbi:MAG: menaquinone biosynthesis decarboxylase [Bacteroidales bacterium]|jgi:4-hydroxy-3-polyprenylbenzoate decarboxylase